MQIRLTQSGTGRLPALPTRFGVTPRPAVSIPRAKSGPAPGLAQISSLAVQKGCHGARQLVQAVQEKLSATAWRCHELLQYGHQTPEALEAIALHQSGAGLKAVNELFVSAHGRRPRAAELSAWNDRLGKGTPLAELSAQLNCTPEARVNAAFQQAFGYPMPESARRYYMGRVAQGESPQALAKWMVAYGTALKQAEAARY